MAKLKKPLDPAIVQMANDDLATKYPELLENGQIIELDPNNPDHELYCQEWVDLYIAYGGELEEAAGSRLTGKTRQHPANPYVKFKDGVRAGTPTKLAGTDGHVFIATSNCIYVADEWPLREYYVYLDIDPTDKVDFETMGMLWTDENGFPHYTDGKGRPTERVPAFVLAWSKKSSTEIERKGASVAMIYDRDPEKLDQKKSKVEQIAAGGPLPNKYRVDLLSKLTEVQIGYGYSACLHVPRDKETLDVDKLKELMKECDAAIEAARKTSNDIYKYVTQSLTNQTLYFHRRTIDQWLDAVPGRRRHLRSNNTRTGKSEYEMACENFDRGLNKLFDAHERSLDKFDTILNDDKKLEQIGQIDLIVEDVYEKYGEHMLWRHQFICEAVGSYSGTSRQQKIYEKFVAPLINNLSVPFGEFRNKCVCDTCEYFQAGKTTIPSPPALTGESFWKSKDLKLGTRTLTRLLDVFTKFKDNIGFVFAQNKMQAIEKIFPLSMGLFLRTGIIKPGEAVMPEMAHKWTEFLLKEFAQAKAGEGKIDDLVKGADNLLKKYKINPKVLPKIGDGLGIIGATFVFWYIFTKEGSLSRKDTFDFMNSFCDVTKAGLNLGGDWTKGKEKLFRAAVEKKFVKTFGEATGKKWMNVIPKWSAGVGAVGGAFQVASSYISLNEAADKGDSREYGWAAVTYTGASISLAGLALDLAPEPLVTKGSGVVLNFVGGIVYLVGTAGEFLTRPDDVEVFLRNEYWWNEDGYAVDIPVYDDSPPLSKL